ncbi:DinB family protein [Shouchella miscanthi]|uniref:DinB family protein n=1 Tax=Shouchella miscanthi TaxID=2598861 RepID=A0ABU6NJL0_9BACI|nr:DinB family protein [Shouchella miscanthi]
MKLLFHYNWQVREEWINWCEQLSQEAFLKERIGGVGSFAKTLHHIIDVEWSWIRRLECKPDPEATLSQETTLLDIRQLHQTYHYDVQPFIERWTPSYEDRIYDDGHPPYDTWGVIMRHIIAHEIHHIGQLSIWARELDLKPVSANVIGRKLS